MPDTLTVRDPATGATIADLPACTPEALDTTMAAAASALPSWAAEPDRPALLRACAAAVRAHAEVLAATLTAEQGKPLADAGREVESVAARFEYYADLEVAEPVLRDDDQLRAQLVRRPVGVVAAITPWNFPLAMAGMKLAPALRAGAPVVLKPSPFTPLATLELARILGEVLPSGVVQAVAGGDELGRRLVSHPVPRKISFTGSTAAGRAIAAAAAVDLKRLTLELGGNDAAVLLDDTDVPAIAERLFWNAFSNNGQICISIKRLYVPRALHDEVIDALAEIAKAVPVGPGTTPGVRLGPLATEPQHDRVAGLADDARRRGATFAAGGARIDGPGNFFEPTIVAGLADDAPLVAEEQFGPILPVLAYDDLDDALRRANDSPFGLGGSVWGADADRAEAIARRLDCGTAWVNTHVAAPVDLPLSGMKQSGMGVENGTWGLESFTEMQVVHRRVEPAATH